MKLSPIALFVYNRLRHLQQTIESLKINHLAKESELYVFSDGPKDKEAEEEVKGVREYLKSISGFKDVSIHENKDNLGTSKNIIKGVTSILNEHGKVIVLEDDLQFSPYFLKFMNDALKLYENESKVISVCGYMYPVKINNCETLFLRIPDCWGWATWKRGWDLFADNGKQLYDGLKAKKLFRRFNLDGSFNYVKMLKSQFQGKNDSWAIRWYAAALLNDKLSLYPSKTLAMNMGFDCSGRHGGAVDYFKSELSKDEPSVNKIPIVENQEAVRKLGFFWWNQKFNFNKKIPGFFRKIKHTWLKI
ncbi:MAG: glycosyltransferase family A protein [Candidatus Omnitrophica bacterium]|nr:glycosyltransferase family A protein [Candidatus Omnitrophota bacterium]